MFLPGAGLIHLDQALIITYNPLLPTCEAAGLQGQLEGYTGGACIKCNGDDACQEVTQICPPGCDP